jgi:hypothetical protein
MLHIFIDIALGYHTVWWPVLSQDTSWLFQTLVPMYHRSVNQCFLVQVHLINLASNMDVGFQLFQAQNMFHFFLTGNFSSAEAK